MSDANFYIGDDQPIDVTIENDGVSVAAWGAIYGELEDQVDLVDALAGKQPIGDYADAEDLEDHISDTDNPHEVNAAQLNLENVDNTRDIAKPISNATQIALNGKQPVGDYATNTNLSKKADQTYVDSRDALKLNITDVLDSLTDTNTTKALSANQGRILKGFIDTINTLVASNDTSLDQLQEIVDFIKINRSTLNTLSVASIAGLQTALNLKANQATTYTKTESDAKDIAVATTAETNLTAHKNATDPHPQYINEARGDARYANAPYNVMSKATFANLLTEYGLFGQRADNAGYGNDLVVYGQSTQLITGNMFNKASGIVSGMTLDATGGAVAQGGEFYQSDFLGIAPLTTVAMSQPSTNYTMKLYEYDANKVFIKRTVSGSLNFAIAMQSNTQFIRVTGALAIIDSIQVEIGSTATAYKPYSRPTPGFPVPIVSSTGNQTIASRSKNLIPNLAVSEVRSGITFTVNADKSVTAVGTATADILYNLVPTGTLYLPANSTFTISGATGGSVPTYYYEVRYKKSGADNYPKTTNGPATFTTIEENTNASTYIRVLSGAVMNTTFYPQVEIGSSATAYEKNTTSTQTLPLGTTQLRSLPNGVSDRIYKSGSSWFLEQNVGSFTTNGSGKTFQSYALNTAGNQRTYFNVFAELTAAGGVAINTGTAAAQISNTYVSYGLGAFNFGTPNTFNVDTNNNVNLIRTAGTPLADFQAGLIANPLNVLYQLAPITTQISDTTLITALENIRTYQGVTNITASTPISASYGIDLNSALTSKANATDVTTGLATKVDKTSTANRVYATDGTGAGVPLEWSFSNTLNTIARRDGSGRLAVATPTSPEHAITKAYMDARILTGSGMPNGLVSATVGATYTDTAVTNGATTWIKRSGTGTTGWHVLDGDTGWRNITSLFSNLEVVNVNDTGVFLRRIGGSVYFAFKAQLKGAWVDGFTVTLPVGMRGQTIPQSITEALQITSTGRLQLMIATSVFFVSGTATSAGLRYYTSAVVPAFPTEPWPTTLPGTPA
jgi:hypothetical protein